MTDRTITKRGYAQDGYSKSQPLHEGWIKKGGTNPSRSQVHARPPAPQPMRSSSGSVPEPQPGGTKKT